MARRKLMMGEKTKNKDLSGKVYIVTGANSGVGLETTRHLVKQGAHVIMACRRIEAGEKEGESFSGLKGSYKVMKLDLADLSSVRNFVKDFLVQHDKLDGIACNAGALIMGKEPTYTIDGFEMTMAASYFGHFLLVELLLEQLKRSDDARIVLLSSCGHAGKEGNRYDVHIDDINYKKRKYDPTAAYGEAKVANNLYAMELADRLKDTNITAYSVHPGWARSNFGSGNGNGVIGKIYAVTTPLVRPITDTNEEAAQTSLHCLISKDATQYSGKYFSQSSILYADKYAKKGGWPMESPNPNARNLKKAKILVEFTYGLVGLK